MQSPDPFGWVGSILDGQFAVEAVAGEGGFGIVYRGTHLGLDVPVAIKCLHHTTLLPRDERESFLAKFRTEAKLLHKLSTRTANIVQALDIGAAAAPNGQWTPYIVMEWLEGETLEDHLDARRKAGGPPLGLDEAIRILTPAIEALVIAHRDRVTHRDLKPANLFLWRSSGNAGMKVLDFGIAKVFSETPSLSLANDQTSERNRAFTPSYGAPEQFSLTYGATGPWTDVFAMALILIEVASGRRVLHGETLVDRYKASIEAEHRPDLLLGVATEGSHVASVLRRALAVNPATRFQSMDALWSALDEARRRAPEPLGTTVGTRDHGGSLSAFLPTASPSGRDMHTDFMNRQELDPPGDPVSWKWSGKWVLVAGTGKDDQISAEVRAEAQAIGEHLATHGYGLITAGWPGVDHRSAVAYVGRLRELGVEPSSYFKQVLDSKRAPLITEGTIANVEMGVREYVESVKLADALVLIGGLGGTYEVYDYAKVRHIPVFPLPATGGDAGRVFVDLCQKWDLWSAVYPGLDRERLDELDAPNAGASGAVTRLLQTVLGSSGGAAIPAPGSAAAPAPGTGDATVLIPRELTGAAARENEAALRRLLDTFRDPGVMGFVGAGSSVRAGYPWWTRLLDMMHDRLAGSHSSEELDRASQEPDLVARAGLYRKLFDRGKYNTFMREQFGPEIGAPGELHRDLVSLPFRHLLTTNYDDLLERAHVSAFTKMPTRVELTSGSAVQDFLAHAGRRKQRRYVYLHGRYDNPAEIVLTEEDYQRRYAQSDNAETLLTALFASQRFLFIGFSLSDLDSMAIFRRVVARLQFEEPLHFALTPLGASDEPIAVRQRLQEQYKIDPIFYPATMDHGRLQGLVARLLKELQPRSDARRIG